MNLHALRVFNAVADCGNVTRAAGRLSLSQPAVTAQLRNLEHELGVQLVLPSGRGIALTDAGLFLFSYSRRLFALEHEIERKMDDLLTGAIGKLRVVATYLPATTLLPYWLAQFKVKNESIEITMTTENTRNAYDLLLEYKADIGIIGGGWEEPGITADVLLEDDLWFTVPPDHKYASQEVSLKQIMQEPFIMREPGSSTRERLLAMCKSFNVNEPIVGLELNGLNETIRAVIAGYGVNCISALAVREYVERGEVARVYVRDLHMRRPIALCTRTDDELSRPARNFIGTIKEGLASRI